MSEDLDSFFAKRKNKASKKKGAIKIDEVGQTLENNLRFGQNEADLPKRANDSEFLSRQDEDSEWIGYEVKPAVQTETVGVFNYNEQVEQEYIAEERKQQAEKAKIWQKTADPEPVKEDTPPTKSPTPVPEPVKVQAPVVTVPKAYVPPGARSGGFQALVKKPVHKVDLQNEQMFPSLGDTIGKEEKPQKPKPVVVETPQPVQQEKTPEPVEPTPASEPIPQDPVIDQPPTVDQHPVTEQKPRTERPNPFGAQENRYRPTPPAAQQRPAPAGQRGTGIFNAKGEEIMVNERPAAPAANQPTQPDLTWRRAAGNTIQETRPLPAQSPPLEQQRQAPSDRQPPEKPEITNWRANSKPVSTAPQQQQQSSRHEQRRHHDRPRDHHPRHGDQRHGDQRHGDHRQGDRDRHGDRHGDRPADPKHENQSWRRDEPAAEPVATDPNPPVQQQEEAGDEDWHTVSANRNKNTRRNAPGGPAKSAYVPPFRR